MLILLVYFDPHATCILVTSNIQQLIEKYGKFENILPEELSQVDFKELEILKCEVRRINEGDLVTIKQLSRGNNTIIDFDEFKKWDYIIKMGFFRESDNVQQEIPWYFAHWYMSMVTLDMLANSIVEVSSNLVEYYKLYMNPRGTISDRKTNFNHFVRTWQDFYGFLINIKQTIYEYYDLFVRTCNLIDPKNEENPYYEFKSDEGPGELYAAVKELLLHGNRGRLTGFALLRSMLDVAITRKLFDLEDSDKYKGKEIVFKKDITSIPAICRAIDRLKFTETFKTDTIMRLYDWLSIVSHRAIRSDEYVTWFVRNITGLLCNNFYKNIQIYREDIIKNLVDTAQIELKDKISYEQ